MQRLRSNVGLVVAILSAVALCLCILAYVVTTRWGGQMVGKRLTAMLSKEIPGTLVVDDLVVTGWFKVHAPRVRFLSPKGDAVIDVHEVTMSFVPGALIRGRITAESAFVERGVVNIKEQADGYTDMEVTFSAPGPATGEAADIDLRSIKFDHLGLNVRFQGGGKAVARNLKGMLRIRNRSEKPGVTVQLENVSGDHLEPSFAGMKFRLSDVDGRVQGKAKKVMDFTGLLSDHVNRVRFDFQLYDREKTPVVLELIKKETNAGFDIRAQVAEWFAPDDVDLKVR